MCKRVFVVGLTTLVLTLIASSAFAADNGMIRPMAAAIKACR